MASPRIVIGILAILSIMLIAMLVLIERGDSSSPPPDSPSTLDTNCIQETRSKSEYQSMRAIAAPLLILASVLAVHFANGASGGGRPPGVEERNWIPVSDKMGFVVTTPQMQVPIGDRQQLLLTPPAEGYFMVYTGNGWQRLTIKDPLKGPGTAG